MRFIKIKWRDPIAEHGEIPSQASERHCADVHSCTLLGHAVFKSSVLTFPPWWYNTF